jgi:hypothetical protein
VPLDISDIAGDVADLMTETVNVEVRGTTKGSRGGPVETWSVERAGVPCLILDKRTQITRVADQEVPTLVVRLLFDAAVELGPTRRVVYTDPSLGATRYFRNGMVRNVANGAVLWIADAEETR